VGLTLTGVAWMACAVQFAFRRRRHGRHRLGLQQQLDADGTAPVCVDGRNPVPHPAEQDMFKGLAPWVQGLPGRLLHTNVIGCTIFAAVSGSSAATCATIGKMTLPELTRRGYPDHMVIGTLAGAATLGLLIPPSIIMIVYGVAAEVSISKLFIAGVLPGLMLACCSRATSCSGRCANPDQVPASDRNPLSLEKLAASRSLIPVVLLISAVLGSIYSGIATATEAAAVGVVGSLVILRACRAPELGHVPRRA
jgi:C4-dicarboxylate transporter DctM subunit